MLIPRSQAALIQPPMSAPRTQAIPCHGRCQKFSGEWRKSPLDDFPAQRIRACPTNGLKWSVLPICHVKRRWIPVGRTGARDPLMPTAGAGNATAGSSALRRSRFSGTSGGRRSRSRPGGRSPFVVSASSAASRSIAVDAVGLIGASGIARTDGPSDEASPPLSPLSPLAAPRMR
jgi:hypothetical protein